MSKNTVVKTEQPDFSEVVHLIAAARQHAYQAVNTTLIDLYWQVGAYISNKIKAAEWGDGVVDALAKHLALTQPNLQGFTRRNLFRMRQFYETYQGDQIVSALLRQLPWTHNLIILQARRRTGVLFENGIKEKWSSRELERQFTLPCLSEWF
jgi:predicted nuclease of restriction endonuclease-like (RecB) superfamily